jgi:hypothetical protein
MREREVPQGRKERKGAETRELLAFCLRPSRPCGLSSFCRFLRGSDVIDAPVRPVNGCLVSKARGRPRSGRLISGGRAEPRERRHGSLQWLASDGLDRRPSLTGVQGDSRPSGLLVALWRRRTERSETSTGRATAWAGGRAGASQRLARAHAKARDLRGTQDQYHDVRVVA